LRDIKIYSDVQQREYTWSVDQTAEVSKHALWASYLPHLTEDVSSTDLIAHKEEGTEVAMRASALYGPGTCAVSSRCEQWKVTTGEHAVQMAILLLTMDFATDNAASDKDGTYSREEALESFGNCLSSLLLKKADWGASAYSKIINMDKHYILTHEDLSEVVGKQVSVRHQIYDGGDLKPAVDLEADVTAWLRAATKLPISYSQLKSNIYGR
jgi:hypothetical protein